MSILDRYVLLQTIRRLTIALGIVLLALILERILRLFEFAAANHAAMGLVFQMAANLIPYYLGLALPAAFFISILLLMAQLGDDNELDVILGSGSSVRRMARTVITFGMVLCVFNILLLGYIQPYSRYAYRAVRHIALHAAYNEAITPGTFFTPVKGLTIVADEVDFAGRGLSGVFVHQIGEDGRETTITAITGQVETDELTDAATIILEDVVQIIEQPEKAPYTLYLKKLIFRPDFPLQAAPFRQRGAGHRELTLDELIIRNMKPPSDDETLEEQLDRRGANSELNARLVRSLSVATMPFLAVPMGISAKRRSRGLAVATAAILLFAYNYTIEIGEGLVGLGVTTPLIGLWLPFILFTLFCLHMFWKMDHRLRPNKFGRFLDHIDAGIQSIKQRIWPKKKASG